MRKITHLIIICLSLFMAACAPQSYAKTQLGIKTTVDSTEIEVQFYSPKIVRIVKSKTGFSFEKQSLSVVKEAESVELTTETKGDEIVVSSTDITVHLNQKTGKISFYTLNGTSLLNEKGNGTQFTPIKDVDEDSYVVSQSFVLDQDEEVYGLGQFQDGKMSQRDQELYLLQDILITAIPMLQSDKGYGIYWDNYSPTYFSDNKDETSFRSTVGDCVDYYFMYGGNADGVIAQMRDLTGQAPMFPYWTYGFWQSKERYKSQDETVDVVKKYRELGVPLDGIIQDWQYWGDNYHWNAMDFFNPKFPEPQKLVDQIHSLNANIIFSIWSSFGPQTKPFKELDQNNMLFDFKTWPLSGIDVWPPDMSRPSGVKVYDAYNPKARDIYWKYLNKGIFRLGNDGWWMDSTEPDHFNRVDSDYNQKTYLGSFRKFRNAYPLMTVGGVYTHQRETSTEKRVFILTRSAFAGQQRYAANSWSGDVVTDWNVLRNQISAGLNFSLCGVPYWNSDIGGFFTGNFPGGVKNKAYHEIYVRWLQFGTFCPMMRSHGTDTPREIFQFGKKGDWSYDAIEKFINLRYRLLPYIYSTSWEVTSKSSSMMRALVMDFSEDKNALDINNEYMFGKSFLVCPVTEPMYVKTKKDENKYVDPVEDFSKVKSTSVYLPAGTQWFDFWTGKSFKGGQTIEKETPISIMPLYVKAGSIVPWGPEVQYASEKKADDMEIRIFPGADGEFTLYEDEGDNYNYEKGKYATITFNWNDSQKTLSISDRKGEFPGMLSERQFRLVLVDETAGIGLDESTPVKTVNYSGKAVSEEL
ncbi:TIM-barrel domain-containing protein [uncultured Sunxiuqinia sp.]|uniref:glycoside hydrolase family 31 protein n=1 Tax=uncultured Sunxiuqinia sp. TaxID=1573825 RepID=UPI002AA7C537|nr:TIM-barrel domain-containing protein [uncultured Sunxiuqinia sp.]